MRFYVQNWLLILSVTLAGLAAGLAYNEFIQVPMYKSNATLLFVNPNGTSSTQDATRLSNYVQLFQSRRVLEPVISKQELGVTFDEFIGGVSATNTKGTEVITLSVSTDNPEKSRNFLRAAVVSFKEEAEELYNVDALTVVDNASNAEPPYNVKKPLQLAIATGAGFVISLIVLFFIYDASGGKAGKLGSKKGGKKQAKASVTPKVADADVPVAKPVAPVVAEQAVSIESSKSDVQDVAATPAVIAESAPTVPAAVATTDSKVKAFFTQLGQDFKDGLWIEQPPVADEPKAPVKKPVRAAKAAKTAKPARTAKATKTAKPAKPAKSAKKPAAKKKSETTNE